MDSNGEMCKNDNDCPDTQFCYDISKRCVNTLDCSRYNRMKGKIHTPRDPSQCGPCMKGYSSELLATGKETPSCKHTENQDGLGTLSVYIIIIIIAGVSFVISALCMYSYRRKFLTRCRNNQITFRCNSESNNASDIPKVESNNLNAMTIASAPEEEQEPFIECGKKGCDCVLYNNNEGIRETNQYQNSVPFTPPQRRPINAYTHNNDMNINNSNINPLNRQVAIIMPENNITIEADLPNNDELLLQENDNSDTTDSASEPNNQSEQGKKSKNIIITQMVQQNITLNLQEEE